ncbi:DUF6883 domain-containing protein [Pediococcus pentosaceus]|uniref:DUF6883 domain-containing protein n=1 Tax=Pediococcus pentosaceus TaxID=1255 RepID=UPI002D218891|nr:DUF6883 domain-containing protein [Pediococcus pentosaceus]
MACKNSFLLRDDLFIIPSLKSCLRNQLTSKSNYKDLMQQVYDNLGKFKAVEKGEDQYGTKFEVNMMIHGPNGKTKNVLTAWKVTWLTSIYVKDKG